ncbi:hypothetical protein HAX54_001240 [Datura stramonium]|uniref:Uncharacterized protein n=1 Tax=Datura stramonium TaxID=4076 RepID=A0ABS8WVF8_DATST|nr:hypothetical protein [Datura stramonium]
MDCSSNVNRPLPFHIDLNETPLPSPREIERGLFLEPPEPSRVKRGLAESDSVVTLSQRNVRVCSSCQSGSSRRRDQQEEWKCFRCVLGNSSRGSGAGARGGGGEVEMLDMNASRLLDMNASPLLDMNASPPRESEGEGLFHFVDLNKDLPVAGRQVEQNHGAKYEFYFFIYPFFPVLSINANSGLF